MSNTRVDEHLEQDCWCTHSPGEHQWDPARDYRELICWTCRETRIADSTQGAGS